MPYRARVLESSRDKSRASRSFELTPLELLWQRVTRPVERAAWERMLHDRSPDIAQRWSERAIRWWAEHRLRRSVARETAAARRAVARLRRHVSRPGFGKVVVQAHRGRRMEATRTEARAVDVLEGRARIGLGTAGIEVVHPLREPAQHLFHGRQASAKRTPLTIPTARVKGCASRDARPRALA